MKLQSVRVGILSVIAVLWVANARVAFCSIVTIVTDQGTIELQLFDVEQPAVVNNFLAYVEGGDYANSVVHRALPQIIQGGGFTISNGQFPGVVPRTAGIHYPLGPSNLRGTIAMAENSAGATSQWFINLADNTGLDSEFTVFGEVTSGLEVADLIAALPRFNFSGLQAYPTAFQEVPLENYTSEDIPNGLPTDDNFIVVSSMTVPEPHSAALVALLTLGALRRRPGSDASRR